MSFNNVEIDIHPIENKDTIKWDELVSHSSLGNIFLRNSWLKITSETYKNELILLGFYRENELIGGCPLFIRKKYGYIKYGSNVCGIMPYSGIIINDNKNKSVREYEMYLHELLETLSNYLLDLNFDIMQIVTSPEFKDVRPFIWNGWDVGIRYTHLIDPYNIVLSENVKRGIKLAIKNGVIIEKSYDIDNFYSLNEKMYKIQNLKTPINYDYLKKIFDYITNNSCGELWIAKTKEGNWIGGQIIIWDEKIVHHWVGATDIDFKKTGGYTFLMNELIKYYIKINRTLGNPMMANIKNFSYFITGFNPQLVTYFSIQKKSFKYKIIEKIR